MFDRDLIKDLSPEFRVAVIGAIQTLVNLGVPQLQIRRLEENFVAAGGVSQEDSEILKSLTEIRYRKGLLTELIQLAPELGDPE